MKINPGIVLSYENTDLALMGNRDSLFIREKIGITDSHSNYIEIDLKQFGITEEITNYTLFQRIMYKTIGRLMQSNTISKRLYHDIGIIISNNNKSKIANAIIKHKALLHEDYDDIPEVSIHRNSEKVVFKIPTRQNGEVKIVFVIKGRQYRVIVNVNRTDETVLSIVRWKKVLSFRSLLNYLDSWSNDNTISSSDRELIKSCYSDIETFFTCSKNKEPLKMLIDHINQYTYELHK